MRFIAENHCSNSERFTHVTKGKSREGHANLVDLDIKETPLSAHSSAAEISYCLLKQLR